MRFDAYYLISGRPALREHSELDPDFAELLCEPLLIRNAEGGRTAWSDGNHTIVIKLLHLLSLRKECGALPPVAAADGRLVRRLVDDPASGRRG